MEQIHDPKVKSSPCKYAEAISLPEVRADVLAATFAHEFIGRFGHPKIIRSDQGPKLIGRTFSSMANSTLRY
uniref:Integrase catalytic domain-containing protein n=1 Tax=Trichogramma kaykai TaxID=54128 RepID=A0ABD2X1L9_9HYME